MLSFGKIWYGTDLTEGCVLLMHTDNLSKAGKIVSNKMFSRAVRTKLVLEWTAEDRVPCKT